MHIGRITLLILLRVWFYLMGVKVYLKKGDYFGEVRVDRHESMAGTWNATFIFVEQEKGKSLGAYGYYLFN
ncbi:hypothetical protein ACB092_09G182400 [Castanea dentata]